MITKQKLKIYSSYKGDIDMWARTGSTKEKFIITDSDWHIIDLLIQDVNLVSKGLTSIEYSQKVDERLRENCDSPETISYLQKIAKNPFV